MVIYKNLFIYYYTNLNIKRITHIYHLFDIMMVLINVLILTQ